MLTFLIKNNPFNLNFSSAYWQIFSHISPPTQGVGGLNYGHRGHFWSKIRCTDFCFEIRIFFTLFGNKFWNLPIHIRENRLVPDRIPESRAGPGRIKVSKPGPNRIRNKKNFQISDQTRTDKILNIADRFGPVGPLTWRSVDPWEYTGHLRLFYVK